MTWALLMRGQSPGPLFHLTSARDTCNPSHFRPFPRHNAAPALAGTLPPPIITSITHKEWRLPSWEKKSRDVVLLEGNRRRSRRVSSSGILVIYDICTTVEVRQQFNQSSTAFTLKSQFHNAYSTDYIVYFICSFVFIVPSEIATNNKYKLTQPIPRQAVTTFGLVGFGVIDVLLSILFYKK